MNPQSKVAIKHIIDKKFLMLQTLKNIDTFRGTSVLHKRLVECNFSPNKIFNIINYFGATVNTK